MASKLSKQLVFGSFAGVFFVVLMCLLDLLGHFPFGGNMLLDILFLLSAAIVGYLSWSAYRDLT